MPTLTLGYPAKVHVNANFMNSFMDAIPVLKEQLPYEIKTTNLIGKSNLPHARSIMLTSWYRSSGQGDLFMFIDTDQTFTPADIIRVVNQEGDLRAGIYGNKAGMPTSVPSGSLDNTINNPLEFAATGFLCITYEAAKRVHQFLREKEKIDTVIISDNHPLESSVIPFFQPVFAILKQDKTYWLGEDFAFSYRAKASGLKIMGAVTGTIGHEIPIIVNYKNREDKLPIHYYCGTSFIKFSPNDPKLGGSEQGVVYLSEAFSRLGHSVTVYGNVEPGVYNNVVYKKAEEFNPRNPRDIVILWRRFGLQLLPYIVAKQLFIDLHDTTDPVMLPMKAVDKIVTAICVKSQYHRSIYKEIPDNKFKIIPNGLQIGRIKEITSIDRPRINNKFCYTSSYDRGLIPILKYMWPPIKQAIPDATFEIHYGSELLPEHIKSELAPLLQQPGVSEHGRSNYDEVIKLRQTCLAQLYVSPSPLEIDCLAVREAAYVGCIPIISNAAVFPERIGVHIEGDPIQEETHKRAAQQVIALANLPEQNRQILREQMSIHPLNLTWDEIAKQWVAMFV